MLEPIGKSTLEESGRSLASFLSTTSHPRLVVGCGWALDPRWDNRGHKPLAEHSPEHHFTIDACPTNAPDVVGEFEEVDLSAGEGRFEEVFFEYVCAFRGQVKVEPPLAKWIDKADSLLATGGLVRFISGAKGEREKVAALLLEKEYTNVKTVFVPVEDQVAPFEVRGSKPKPASSRCVMM